jgi:integrase
MAAKLTKTSTPGVFKRGNRYAVIYRDGEGRQRQQSARTYDEARRLRSTREASVSDGSYQAQTRERFADYALAWVERYQGTGRHGFAEHTRNDYRRDLKAYANRRLGRLRLEQITPRHIAEFVAWLCDEDAQGRHLADATVRRILAPVRSCLRSAMREGLIRHNPTQGAALPARDERRHIESGTDELGDEQDVRAMTSEQLAALLSVAPARHRLMFELMAATGLRISEAVALRVGDLTLNGERPVVHVRRAFVRGAFKPPKSRHGRRQVPIEHTLVRALRRATAGATDPRALLFPDTTGEPLHASNLLMREFKPAAEEAGVPWAGFHTLRHTCATRLFADGRNAVQVQRWLGHSDPGFTLRTYVHLLDDELGEPLGLPSPREPEDGVSEVSAAPTPEHATTKPGQRVIAA